MGNRAVKAGPERERGKSQEEADGPRILDRVASYVGDVDDVAQLIDFHHYPLCVFPRFIFFILFFSFLFIYLFFQCHCVFVSLTDSVRLAASFLRIRWLLSPLSGV